MPVAKTKSTKSSGRRRAVKAHTLFTFNPPSYHSGANDERTAILAKVRRDKKSVKDEPYLEQVWLYLLNNLEPWLLTRDTRYKKNPGGL